MSQFDDWFTPKPGAMTIEEALRKRAAMVSNETESLVSRFLVRFPEVPLDEVEIYHGVDPNTHYLTVGVRRRTT